MRAYRISLALFVAALVGASALGMWAWPARVNEAAHEAYSERVVRIETLVHRLHEQVLRAHAGLAGSVDPLVQTLRELREVHEAAALVPRAIDPRSRAHIETRLRKCNEMLDQQAALVERFKSQNAVLLNSLLYFPGAAAAASEGLATTEGTLSSANELRDLLRDVLSLVVSPTPEVRAGVERHLRVLRAAALSHDVELLLRHAVLIVQRRQVVDDLLSEFLDQPAVEHAQALAAAYAHGHALAVQRDEAHLLTAFVLAIVLVMLAATTIILRLKASSDALARTTQQLAHAVEAQNRFVSMTSHEFRTPLSVIVSSAELLGTYSEKWAVESRTKHLKRIDRAARGMTDLLDGLLLIGRSDAGHREFRASDVDIDALASESVEAQRLRAKDGITVELTPSRHPKLVRLDTRLFRHVMDNLVSNGVKYSKAGGVVHVALTCDGKEVSLRVEDEGIGIPPRHLARLFDTFSRAKNVGAVQGTGLGLAIVKRAVEQHSGKIEASSEVGVGTKFVVLIPVEPPRDREMGTSGSPA